MAFVIAVGLPVAGWANPHGGYSPTGHTCSRCHVVHQAPGAPLLTAADGDALCLSCHDGGVSALDIESELASGSGSSHPIAAGTVQCVDCHTPHEGPAEGNMSSLSTRKLGASSGAMVCGACHGAASALPGGDMASGIVGTPHESVVPSDSPAAIGCRGCHTPHASSADSLIRTQVRSSMGTTVSVTGEPGLCLACHTSADGAFSGLTVSSMQKHTQVDSSSRALTEWPGSTGDPGGCDGCHEPHGKGAGLAYTRVDGDVLCETCHADASVSYPAGYSYRGSSVYALSGHAGISSPDKRYLTLTAEGPDFGVWEGSSEPTPSIPGVPVPQSRAAALTVADNAFLSTALQDVNGAYDHQLYHFTVPATTAEIASARIHWEGYGEEAPGFPVSLHVWVPATESWEMLQSSQMVSRTSVNIALRPADHVAADGSVYVMARARFCDDEFLVSGPTITTLSATSVRVEWVTSGLTDGWVDYGATTTYTKLAGSGTRTQTHVVNITGLTSGVWHFRVRSTALDGGSYTSADMTHGLPVPTITAEQDYPWDGTDPTVTLQWSPPAAAPGGPFEFRMHLQQNGSSYISTGWSEATTHTATLGLGTYTWRVEARDSSGVWYGYSAWDTFYVWDNTGSCPFLFTWDGESYAFEADLYGPGKLGLETRSGYVKPTPDDVYMLEHEPAVRDGLLDLRLVEERVETDYLDELALYSVEVPADRDVYAEKREAGGALFGGVDSVLHTVARDLATPAQAVQLRTGEDVRALIANDDGSHLVLSNDRNTDFDYETIELDLGEIADAENVKVVMDAVSMFPSTVEGAQRAATFGARTKLEVQDAAGDWVVVPASAGALPKPPEFSRPYVFDISGIWVSESRRVRFTFLLKTYIDWIAVDITEDVPVTLTEVPLVVADLRVRGIDDRSSDSELYEYTYGEPSGRTAYLPGDYTRLGDVRELLMKTDDRFVIYGGGDEIALGFQPPAPPAEGFTRRYAVHTNGYYKDLKADVAHEVSPLPFAGMSTFPYGAEERYPDDADHAEYLETWNTRTEGELSDAALMSGLAEYQPASGDDLWSRAVTLMDSAWRAVVEFFGTAAPEQSAVVVGPADDGPVQHRSLNTDVVALELVLDRQGPSGTCLTCHAAHGGMSSGRVLSGARAAQDGTVCTAAGSGCHSDAANSAGGVDVLSSFTSGSSHRARHDALPLDQIASGGRTACADCHNPHRENPSSRYSDPDDVSVGMSSPLRSVIAEDGSVYVLVGGDHDGTGPVISGITVGVTAATKTSPTVSWTTNERATSYIDWGLTTAYELGNATDGTSFGSGTLVTAHAVTMLGLSEGTLYHYRIRTTDALGNTSVSPDRTYKVVDAPPAPVMSDVTTQTGPGVGPIAVAFSASTVSPPDGNPAQYQFEIVGVRTSGWLSTPSWSWSLADGSYQVRVRARDSVWDYAVSGWSSADQFVVVNAPESGSCPFLFTWDGGGFSFEADMFGSGKLGTRTRTGTLRPRPEDPYLLDTRPVAVDGEYRFSLVEERYEVDYLDQVKLLVVDVPHGHEVYAEKFQAGGVEFPGIAAALHTVALPLRGAPRAVHVQSGTDVTAQVAARDGDRVVLNEDRNADFEYQTIELDLGDIPPTAPVKLVMDAVSVFPNTDEGALQASGFGARTKLEVQDEDGTWVEVPSTAGTLPKPPEFSRPYAFDISDIWISDRRSVRLTFLFKTYVDWIAVDTSEDVPVRVSELPLLRADLGVRGIDPTDGSGELYEYVYGEPTGKTAYFAGAYTRLGDVMPLLDAVDDEFVVFGGGDEVTLSFDATREPAGEPGGSRRYLFYSHGYYKDAKVGLPQTVEPLPFDAMSNYPYPDDEAYPDDERHREYLDTWNTRIEGGTVTLVRTESASETLLRFESWRTYHFASWSTSAITVGGTQSLDTDAVVLRVQTKGGAITAATPVAGWETTATVTARPTPSAPGTAVGAAELAAIAAVDGTQWSTGLSVEDRVWNWQLVKYDLGASAIDDTKEFALSWTGHGEATAGYATAVYVWNPALVTWTTIRSGVMPTAATVGMSVDAISGEFCLRCHDGTAAGTAVVPGS
ncbi:MAG: fibronectin type III domain-containing protein, partial [Coriobacteriia bacterium]|nr:fibronectin type III domain-containing protein [Coriobacteriia bacterium]